MKNKLTLLIVPMFILTSAFINAMETPSKSEAKRTVYQPKSLVVTLLPHIANSETLEQDLSQLPKDLSTVPQLLGETKDVKQALLKALDVYINKKEELTVSLKDIELLFYLYTGFKPTNLSTIPTEDLDRIFGMFYSKKGNFDLVLLMFLTDYRTEKNLNESLAKSNLLHNLELLFSLGVSGNVCIPNNHGLFPEIGIIYKEACFQPLLHFLAYDYWNSLGSTEPSFEMPKQEDKEISLKLIKLCLDHNANLNESCLKPILADSQYSKTPLLTDCIRSTYKLFVHTCAKVYIDIDFIESLLKYGYDLQATSHGKTLIQEVKEMIQDLRNPGNMLEGSDHAIQEFEKLLEFLQNYSKPSN